ncbi:PilZ domain-containing protein [Aromatoleum sp.]|uniref:PilZ domain-containing protein n=1 Tax=Aromatoleum sp. TaxID=2307007 RepID=UPI002B49BB44|nr:PilZ domain-containing protein [Aromatoleum sp.]
MNDLQRRKYSRIQFHSGATLSIDDSETACEVCDLSLKGALLRVAPPVGLTTGKRCLLEVALDEAGTSIRMEGEVVHAEGDRVGLLCREIDLDSITHLRRLLELNLGDPELLHREFSALLSH